jgi:hypothetical protein
MSVTLPTGRSLSLASAGAVNTAAETLHVQEVARTRSIVRMGFGLGLAGVPIIFVLGGDPLAKSAYLASLVLTTITTGIYAWLLRADEGYSNGRSLFVGAFALASSFAGIYYFGAFSAATAILPFGLFFFSSSQSLRSTIIIYAVCAGIYLLLATLIISGALRDRGLLAHERSDNPTRIVLGILLESVLLLSFVSARVARQAALTAIERHDVAIKRLAQREALLEEAKQELERALAFSGLGRFSDTIVGSFKLGKVIGRGAMGEVYDGAHTTTGAHAAVKLLHTHVLAKGDIVKRFLREAQIAASLHVPNVVSVLEIGDLSGPMPFIAMELLEGEDLADHLRRHGQLSPRKISKLVHQIGEGLAAAHAAGIVHRDLKPTNVFLAKTESGDVWKILDFGVSKLINAEESMTVDQVIGTPEYMAPEQALGKPVTGRADLFALGVIIYRALTGQRAFGGGNITETLYQVTLTMPPRPTALVSAHEDVDALLCIAMAKSPDDRFDTAQELADAFDAAVKGELDPALRAKAARLLATNAWETR